MLATILVYFSPMVFNFLSLDKVLKEEFGEIALKFLHSQEVRMFGTSRNKENPVYPRNSELLTKNKGVQVKPIPSSPRLHENQEADFLWVYLLIYFSDCCSVSCLRLLSLSFNKNCQSLCHIPARNNLCIINPQQGDRLECLCN